MTGSDSEEAGHVSRAELATFKQDMANEVAQLQAALQRTVDDIVDTTRSPAPGAGSGINSGPGLQPGSPVAGVPLPGHGAPSIASAAIRVIRPNRGRSLFTHATTPRGCVLG